MQAQIIEANEPKHAEARLPRWMMAVGGAGCLVALFVGNIPSGVGFGLGATIAILSYYWLHHAIESLFAATGARVSWRVVAKYFLRYPLLFVGVYFFYRTGWLPYVSVLAGLFVPVGGVLIESVVQIFEGFQGS